jgi:hypothetical protein
MVLLGCHAVGEARLLPIMSSDDDDRAAACRRPHITFFIALTIFLGWRIRYAPYPLLPLTHHGRNGDIHNHPAAALAVRYVHPKVVESVQFLLLHLDGQMLTVQRRCYVAVSFLQFYWKHHALAHSWGYDCRYNLEDPPVAITSHLQDLAKGKLVLIPKSCPQARPQPCPTWFDSLYLAFQDWRRVAIATMTYGELEYINKLLTNATAGTCDFPPLIEYDVSSEKRTEHISTGTRPLSSHLFRSLDILGAVWRKGFSSRMVNTFWIGLTEPRICTLLPTLNLVRG